MSNMDLGRSVDSAAAPPRARVAEPPGRAARAPGTTSGLVGSLPYGAAVQRRGPGRGAPDGAAVQAAAAAGVAGAGGRLPYADQIQASFGRHDVSGVAAHVGGPATRAARSIDALAYTVGGDVAFAGAPSLHTAAHEAAHVVQQRAGVQLKGGVGAVGDPYERHADAVADAVVSGKSAEGLLDRQPGGAAAGGGGAGAGRGGVQRFYLASDDAPGYEWVTDDQWDPSLYEKADPQPDDWWFYSLYQPKTSAAVEQPVQTPESPEVRAPKAKSKAKGKADLPPPSREVSAQEKFNQIDRLVSQMDAGLKKKSAWPKSGEMGALRAYVKTIKDNKAAARKRREEYVIKESTLARQLETALALKAELDDYTPPPPTTATTQVSSAPRSSDESPSTPDDGGSWTKKKSKGEVRQQAHEGYDLTALAATIDGHTGTPDAISETFNQYINGRVAQGEATLGTIVSKYQTRKERGAGKFSVEVTIPGLANWVIHVHCTAEGATAAGKNPIHYKRLADAYELGVSIQLTGRQEDAMLPSPSVRQARRMG